MDVNKCQFIKDVIFQRDLPTMRFPDYPWAFFIHASVMDKLENLLRSCSKYTMWEIFEYSYPLIIGTESYDMCIVIIKPVTEHNIKFLRKAIQNSQFSFPWADNPTLFISAESFHLMLEFIGNHNLNEYVLIIDEQRAITKNDGLIKVVTFHQRVNTVFDLMEKFENYLSSLQMYDMQNFFYMAFALPWLQPYWLKRIALDDEYYSLSMIILNHIGKMAKSHLSVFDLAAIRIALCDFRNPYPSRLLKYEIDFMINRELSKHVKDKHFDIDQYIVDTNYEPNNFVIYYLVYEFQNLFETIHISNRRFASPDEISHKQVRGIIVLATLDHDVRNVLKEKCESIFAIDGRNYDGMSLSLFLDLIECHNVRAIGLDTNYAWINDVCELTRNIHNAEGFVDVNLYGENRSTFIEDFMSSIKTVIMSTGKINLFVHCNLADYQIFDNLPVDRVYLYGVKIDAYVLNGLHAISLKGKINFLDSTFENTRHNWELMNNLNNLEIIVINEDEGTWQSMFEFISNKMITSNTKEFRFNNMRNLLILSGDKNITFEALKFTVNELSSKLEIHDIFNNTIEDLYDIKFELEPDEKSNYEFYQ